MKKDLNYYLGLKYPIQITEIEAALGGGFQACILTFGNYACCADGETKEEAIENLNGVKKELIERYLKKSISIPEPDEEKISGRFVLRMPSDLHNNLKIQAKKNRTTLNQYCVYLLAQNNACDVLEKNLTELKNGIKYHFKPSETKKVDLKLYDPDAAVA
jgi:predicted HicB family RNase H-like nuclease